MVKPTGIIRKVDELGRVVLPIGIRRAFDIDEKDSLEILVDRDNGRIILKKATKMCLKCGATEDLKELKPGCYLCDACIKELKQDNRQ